MPSSNSQRRVFPVSSCVVVGHAVATTLVMWIEVELMSTKGAELKCRSSRDKC
uniref:Uncharacterized protein n=1 Tax=Heterorhabditis bacteriophora TaxID=37862 RepID=A0A1I7WRK0_HETBA